MSDLIYTTEDTHYEAYRFQKLESGGYGGPGVNKCVSHRFPQNLPRSLLLTRGYAIILLFDLL
jgi:hypothetical protein